MKLFYRVEVEQGYGPYNWGSELYELGPNAERAARHPTPWAEELWDPEDFWTQDAGYRDEVCGFISEAQLRAWFDDEMVVALATSREHNEWFVSTYEETVPGAIRAGYSQAVCNRRAMRLRERKPVSYILEIGA